MGEIFRSKKTLAELETLPKGVYDDLLKFNLTKQRIVELCNEELGDDPLEGEKSYSSFHRALDGHDSYVGIVQALVDLRDCQRSRPYEYLPTEGPGDDLAKWMAQIAKATWWYKLLDLDMTESTLNAWFSGRGKKERPDVREQVDKWWARLSHAVSQVRRVTEGTARDRHHEWRLKQDDAPHALYQKVLSWDTWCKDLIEDGLSIDEVRDRFIDEGMTVDNNYFYVETIDLADPQSPLSDQEPPKYSRGDREYMWEQLVERDFNCAISRNPTDFDAEPYFTEDKWGDRRDENCPQDLNGALYNLHYRTQWTRFWDAKERCVASDTEIVAVSRDGVTWDNPTERQKQGWDRGFNEWLVAMDAGKNTDNSYTQELEKAERAVREIEERLSRRRILPEQASALEEKLLEAREQANWRYTKTDW